MNIYINSDSPYLYVQYILCTFLKRIKVYYVQVAPFRRKYILQNGKQLQVIFPTKIELCGDTIHKGPHPDVPNSFS